MVRYLSHAHEELEIQTHREKKKVEFIKRGKNCRVPKQRVVLRGLPKRS